MAASMQQQQDSTHLPFSKCTCRQEALKTIGVLALAGSHWVLPAGHACLLSPSILAALLVVQLCSLAFSITTSPVLDITQKMAKKVQDEDEVAKAVKSTSFVARKPASPPTLTVCQGASCLLVLIVATKVLAALDILGSPAQGLVLALLLGSATRSALDRRDARAMASQCSEDGSSGESAHVDDDGCPYEHEFWAELSPDSTLDELVQELQDDVQQSMEEYADQEED